MLKSAIAAGVGFAGATGIDLAGMMRAMAGTLSGPLQISNWPYYIDKETVPNFQKRFGIAVNYIEDINDNDSLFGKIAGPLQAGQNPGRESSFPRATWSIAWSSSAGWRSSPRQRSPI
jgi:Spermidine/putrescine-binding periplasmic protein